MNYEQFVASKSQFTTDSGFDPGELPSYLFDFQKHLVDWSCRRGRAAIFADCGTGKTISQLVWAQKVVERTNKRVLILTPLAVANQTEREAAKFGIEAKRSKQGELEAKIVITNYDRLHNFDPADFAGFVCDESSILKSVDGSTRKQITRFTLRTPYRLLCTATAAPNDYVELGTSSEALGELSHSDMLRRFFRQLDDKGQKKEQKLQDKAEALIKQDSNYYGKLAFRVAQTIGQWRLKNHAVDDFWRWVASWARACRLPSDLGFSDEGFVLPELIQNEHIIKSASPPDGFLFNLPARGLGEEREERKRTLNERCEYVANLVNHDRPAVVWCQANAEGDLLENVIPGARQVAGRTPDDEKVEIFEAFASGQLRVLVIKPKIGAWGLNWQHCNHVVSFASHSFEQMYQSIRRCYRFGQKLPVTFDVVATEGEERVLANLRRKESQASQMFDLLVKEMRRSVQINRENIYTKGVQIPSWLQATAR
jgi:hypothetical protein